MLAYLVGGGLAAYLHHRHRYRPTPPSFVGSSTQLGRTCVVPGLRTKNGWCRSSV